jgi:uridine kinase
LVQDLNRLRKLSLGSTMQIEQFQFGTPTSKPTIVPGGCDLLIAPFIITEGIHAFHDPALIPLYDLKIYVDIDEKARRERWLARNRQENRGTTDNMWNTTVTCLEQHILQTRAVADIVVSNQASKEQVTRFLKDVVNAFTLPSEVLEKGIA